MRDIQYPQLTRALLCLIAMLVLTGMGRPPRDPWQPLSDADIAANCNTLATSQQADCKQKMKSATTECLARPQPEQKACLYTINAPFLTCEETDFVSRQRACLRDSLGLSFPPVNLADDCNLLPLAEQKNCKQVVQSKLDECAKKNMFDGIACWMSLTLRLANCTKPGGSKDEQAACVRTVLGLPAPRRIREPIDINKRNTTGGGQGQPSDVQVIDTKKGGTVNK